MSHHRESLLFTEITTEDSSVVCGGATAVVEFQYNAETKAVSTSSEPLTTEALGLFDFFSNRSFGNRGFGGLWGNSFGSIP